MRKLIYYAFIVLLVQACKKNDDADATYSVDTTSESAQQVGDVSASVDESGGNANGSITTAAFDVESAKKSFVRLSGEELNTAKMSTLFLQEAQAASCNTIAFDTCGTSGTGKRVREFASCTIGTAGVITGNVTLSFNDPCKFNSNGDSVSRVPNFTITGLRGATFTVNAPTSGQTLTRTGAATYDFANTGIRRTFVTPKGVTLLDMTTTTGTPLTVAGDSRTNRVISAGTLIVTNNLTNDTCTLTPSPAGPTTELKWSVGCTCPTQGYWSGNCTPSGNTFKVTYGATCGQVTVEKTGETTQTVVLDRCSL